MTTRSINRRTIAIVALGCAVLAAVAIAFYWAGRQGTAPSDPVTLQPTSSAQPSPSYSPTDQYGSPETGLQISSVRAGEGGSRTGPAGLPLGYPHDEGGAVNAATNYLMWMNSLRIKQKSTADAMAAAAAADHSARGTLVASFDQLRSGVSALTADQPEPARGAFAVAAASDDRVIVYIWSPEVTTDGKKQTQSLWAIDAVEVVWSNGDWKLDGPLINRTGSAAVDPTDPEGSPTAAEKHSILTRTPADPGDITDSADQQWFEYANATH